MRVSVDAGKCSGQGRCYALYPDAYTDDDNGFNAARGQTVDITEGAENSARLGAQLCPEGAITLLEA